MEEVKGEVNGRPYHGIVYSALDKNGEKTGTPVKSSTLGKMTGITALEKQMKQAGTLIREKKLKDRTQRMVSTALRTNTSEADFRKALRQEGIDVVMHRNDTGRIYGITFIDHHSRVVLNGFQLGKEYSANVFNERFLFIEGEQPRSVPDRLLHPKPGAPAFDSETHAKEYFPGSGGLLSLFTPEPEQPEREPLPTKKRKKKRRRYGRQD